MSITATRIGSAPLRIDWTNYIQFPVSGSQLDPKNHLPQWTEAWDKLKKRFASGEVGFYDAPIQPEISQVTETDALAAQILKSQRFTDCLFLGIGGSALGPISLLSSLQERCNTGMRFHIVDNPDPVEWKSTLGKLRPDTTLVCVVTKSGTTFETMAQFLLAMNWLGKSRFKTHVLAITDPTKGDLRTFANKEGIPTLSIAPSIGGRFSIFSPVGLLPAALSGLSTAAFLIGAKQVRDAMEKIPPEKNPIFILGQEMLRQVSKRTIHVCMPYSTRLRHVGAWFVQLWGESLGKDGQGFTPIGAVGATDQHSILQLLRDGPNDKATLFITLDKVPHDEKIPRLFLDPGHPSYASFRLLENHSLQELLMTEYRATAQVLTRQGRPNLTLGLDQLDERALGALYFFFSVLTAFTGTLMGVNPFDQPGVEEGKVYTREALTAAKAASLSNSD